MRIRRVRVRNYKGVVAAEIKPVTDVIVIAGANGTGKSAFLEAIAYFKEGLGPYVTRKQIPNAVTLGADYAEIETEFEFLREEISAFQRAVELRGRPAPAANVTMSALLRVLPNGDVSVVSQEAPLQRLLSFYDRDTAVGVMDYILPYRQMPARRVRSVAVAMALDVEKRRRIYEAELKFNEVKDYLVNLLIRDLKHLNETGDRADSLAPIREPFDALLAPKRLADAVIGDTEIQVLVETPTGSHDIDFLSSGEKEILMVFASLHRMRFTNSVLLYEEPELHLNPALERRLIENLRRFGTNNQIWITTHSMEIADAAEYSELFLMTLPQGGENQLRPMSQEAERLEVFRALGARVGLQLISQKIVFVEGEEPGGDKEVLERLFPEYSDKIQFVAAGSVNVVSGLSERISDLLRQASRYSGFYAIRDRDFLDDKAAQALRAEHNDRLFVLNRYHIENYLLDAEAIAAVAQDLSVASLAAPDQVAAQLMGIADELKDNVVARWSAYDLNRSTGGFDFGGRGKQPLQDLQANARRIRDELGKRLDEQGVQELFEAKYQQIAEMQHPWWLRLCPGRDLLRRLAGKHFPGMNYIYLRNSIISKMRQMDRVPQDFRDILEKILA